MPTDGNDDKMIFQAKPKDAENAKEDAKEEEKKDEKNDEKKDEKEKKEEKEPLLSKPSEGDKKEDDKKEVADAKASLTGKFWSYVFS